MPRKKTNEVRETIHRILCRSNRDMPMHQKLQTISAEIVKDLRATGKLFNTNHGFFYFEERPKPKLYPIRPDAIDFRSLIAERYGINRAERPVYDFVVSALETECHERGKALDVQRLAYYDRESHRLYVSRFNGLAYRLNGRDIREVSNGSKGIFFWDDPDWSPYELFRDKTSKESGGQLKHLIFDSANFTTSDGMTAEDQKWLFSVWLRSHFFASLLPTKPLLLVCGEKGSGKTLALRKWLRLLFGRGGEVTALEREKPDGFVAAVCSKPIIVLDNVDERVRWLPDHLCQLATGVSFSRRKLYTTNEEVKYRPECFLALTSRTPKFIEGRDDVLDRSLILNADRLEAYDAEQRLLQRIAEHRNSIWTELLRDLNKLLAVTPPSYFQAESGLSRMADFAGFACAVAKADGQTERAERVFRVLERRRAEMLASQESIAVCLELWLERAWNPGRTVTSRDLQRELSAIADRGGIEWPYKSAHSLGQRLSHIEATLSQQLRLESELDSSQQRRYRFWPKAETLNRAESVFGDSDELSSWETMELVPKA